MPREAHIAGAGIAGLIAAAALAQRGWSVDVYERADNIRNYGAGISCWYNFVRVLKEIGAFDEAVQHAHQGARRVTRDSRDRVLWVLDKPQENGDFSMALSRGDLLTALANAARRSGVRIHLGRNVKGAKADGTLLFEDGSQVKGDLIVGADGVHSKIRDSLDLLQTRKYLPDVSYRTMLRRRPEDEASGITQQTTEFWSGQRRGFISFLNESEIFVSFMTLPNDKEAYRTPFPRDVWKRSFPGLVDWIDRMPEEGRWDHIQQITLKSWSRGRVAIVGDAAHAMSPNIGQGGGCASVNALDLAHYASLNGDIEARLKEWEANERELTDFTQRVSAAYGKLCVLPPVVRSPLMKVLGRWKWLIDLRQRPARHYATGLSNRPAPRNAA
ncbi:MAG: FAD-dependent monooxygenase [Rhizobium pusense]|nr:FAD-dependent monooxygenase [Agrobacterium pusense]